MKNLKSLLLIVGLVAISIFSFSQMAVVEYVRVKPGNAGKYVEIEKAWKKIHEARIKAGSIESWALYENMFAGADEDFQFALVTIYKDMAAYENTDFQAILKVAYPDYKEKEWEEFFKKTSESRVLSRTEVFHGLVFAEVKESKPPVYLQITGMAVKQGGEAAYEKLEKDYYKPVHEEMIKAGKMEAWGIWAKYPGNFLDYQYVAVNLYSSLSQMNSGNYAETFKKKFPALKAVDISSKTNAARTMTEIWIWKVVERVSKD